MNQLEKMNHIYLKTKEKVIEESFEAEEATEFVASEFIDNLTKELELIFPFQYSTEEEGLYFFASIEVFKEYVLERLTNEEIINSEDYYESSEDEWNSSSC